MNLEEKRKELLKQIAELQNQLKNIDSQISIEKTKHLNLQQYLNKTIVIADYTNEEECFTYIKPKSFENSYYGVEFYGSIYTKGIYSYNDYIIIGYHKLGNIKVNDLDILDQFIKDVREDRIYNDTTDS